MKQFKMMALWLAVVIALAGQWARGGVEGSKHDFSNEAWSGGDRCGVCHTPHRHLAPKSAPLWNRGADLTRTFGEVQVGRGVAGRSTMVCLRCHDGTIAKAASGGVGRTRFRGARTGRLRDTGHGRSDHPVGIAYPQFNKGFRPMTAVLAGGTVVLPNGHVECISCHDQHNTSGVAHMLVRSNARSALCLTCHKK